MNSNHGIIILGSQEDLDNNTNNTLIRLLRYHHIPFEYYDWCLPIDIDSITTMFHGLVLLGRSYSNYSSSELFSNSLLLLITKFRELYKPIFLEFIPYPSFPMGKRIESHCFHRVIVNDIVSPLLESLPALTILEAHEVSVLPIDLSTPHLEGAIELLSIGKVAGVYKANFGFPKESLPVLILQKNLLLSTIIISAFDQMEFRLKLHWETLLLNIIRFLCKGWFELPVLLPRLYDNRHYFESYKNMDNLTRKVKYQETVKRGLNWYIQSDVLHGKDGEKGVYEGFPSSFDINGRKRLRQDDFLGHIVQRADCTADSAFCFWLGSQFSPSESLSVQNLIQWKSIAQNLFNHLYSYWQHYNEDRSIRRGFFGWFNDYYNHNVFYADDNGRCSLQSLLYSYMQQNTPKSIDLFNRSYANINALYQTTGKNGHRPARIDLIHFYPFKGRKWFRKQNFKKSSYQSPHYEGWSMAAILYAAYILQDQSLVTLIQKAIEDYMTIFPKIAVEHSVGDDFSKLLIACVMLYQNTKKSHHLSFIVQIVEFFARIQDPITGAFPECDPFNMHARKEPTNEKYGKGESALYTHPSDTITDQLYSAGFLAWGLYLASKTGKVPQAKSMFERLLDYLSAIQLHSPNPQLDGVWTRGFDYYYGEPYGANGDVGWGAYSLETGWTQGPILTAFLFYLIDFDPFIPLSEEKRGEIHQLYENEFKLQLDIEKNWRKYTPKPQIHPNRLTKKQKENLIQEI